MPMTLRSAPFRPLLLLALTVAIATSGCARMGGMFKDKNKNEGLPVSELYDRAHGFMESGRWSSASETFTRLIAQYPYGPYTEQRDVTGLAEYKSGHHERRPHRSTAHPHYPPTATSPM